MIKAILIFNNHGKPRLIRFYQYFAEDMQQQNYTRDLPPSVEEG
uniref:AP complex mu/sigma subunit domain-containing protein n=1 Tax=Anguilla anguilla TaxID=7936 RepID=A0A0E9P8P9_ANGAN